MRYVSMDSMDFEEQIDRLLAGMTRRQKVGQLIQYGSFREYERSLVEKGEIGSLLNFCGSTLVSDIQQSIMHSPNPVPLLIGDDVIHGYSTGFPIPLAESCSFNLPLIEETAAVAAREASADGVNMIFAPMVDIARDPRWGRVAEGAGEDPYYGSLVAAAWVRGFQRNDWEDRPHVTACPKHYIGYSAAEGGRDYDYTEISEHTLREIYLPPFRAAVEAGAGAVMSSFNDVSGQPASLNYHLLEEILRGDLGFQGPVVTDWESVQQGVAHGVAADDKDAVRIGINNGAEIDMNSGIYDLYAEQLVEEGAIPEERLDEAVRRILRVKLALGLFEQNQTTPEKAAAIHRCPAHIETARQMARESMVLLKNDYDMLPLEKHAGKLAVIGFLADSQGDALGCWQCKTKKENVTTPLAGIRARVSKDTEVTYFIGSGIQEGSEEEAEKAVEGAARADTVIMVLGEACWMSGENNSRAHLGIPEAQQRLLRRVCAVNPRVVLVLMNGRPLTLTWEHEHVPAILEAWQLGDSCGDALADVLFGDYNPSGRLTMTFPRCEGQIPLYYNRRTSGRPELIRYLDEEITPLYPFGFGLSYSRFIYGPVTADKDKLTADDTLHVTVILTNDSDIAGEETVQLYIRDETASMTRPARELKGFQKLPLLPHESRPVTFAVTPEMLAFVHADLRMAAEPGYFRIYVGHDSTCEDGVRIFLEDSVLC